VAGRFEELLTALGRELDQAQQQLDQLNATLDQRVEAALRRVLDHHAHDQLLSTAALAKRWGMRRKALHMRLTRAAARGGDELLAIAREVGGRRVWRLSEIVALEAGQRNGAKQ
jgi:hypothetical protein